VIHETGRHRVRNNLTNQCRFKGASDNGGRLAYMAARASLVPTPGRALPGGV